MATALSLPQVLAGVTPVRLPGGDADRPLAIKVAVAAGSASRLLVGSPDVHTFEVLGGSLLSRTTDLEQVAQPGDVVTDAGTMALLGDAGAVVTVVDRRPTMSGEALVVTGAVPLATTPWSDTLSLDPAESAPWVDFRLRSRPTVLTELRPTVAMFLNFSPPDFDADLGAGERLDAFVRWVQDQVTPVDGIVIQVTLGEKSGFLYVAFGAPVAHEDLASRALGSALSLVRPPGLLAAMGPVRIGLAGGIARAGVYGSRQTLTYGVLGDRVNLAARLMAAAGPDEILLTEELAAEAGPAYRTEARPPVLAKGFEGQVAVAALNGRLGYLPPAAAHDRPLVGRERELAAIGEVVTRLASGTGGIIVVRGEVGVGKGHLLARARHLQEVPGGVQWLITEMREMASTPLDAFASLVADLTFQSLGQTEDDRRQLFDTIVDGVIAEAAAVGGDGLDLAADLSADRPFLGALVGLVWPGSDYEKLRPPPAGRAASRRGGHPGGLPFAGASGGGPGHRGGTPRPGCHAGGGAPRPPDPRPRRRAPARGAPRRTRSHRTDRRAGEGRPRAHPRTPRPARGHRPRDRAAGRRAGRAAGRPPPRAVPGRAALHRAAPG